MVERKDVDLEITVLDLDIVACPDCDGKEHFLFGPQNEHEFNVFMHLGIPIPMLMECGTCGLERHLLVATRKYRDPKKAKTASKRAH